MSAIDTAPDATSGDSAAIAELHEAVSRQHAAFLRDPFPDAAERRARVGAIAAMIVGHRAQVRAAMSADFRVHPELFSDLVEVVGVAGRAAYAAEQLETWMTPQERHVEPALFGSGRAYIRFQPKGVVGNIVPWNFPFDLSVGPLVEMLAAGNRVIIKPSEYTPACAELLRDMVHETFDQDLVDVAVGGADLARDFARVRWDHLLYTGSPAIGREVAKAAAENLVPTTLELGGKCPALVADDAVDAETVKQILGTKAVKNGQMCISVDYCLVPRERVQEFADLAREHFASVMPDYSCSDDCTGIISPRHLDRLVGMLDEARSQGCEILQLDAQGALDPESRRMPLSLVMDPPDGLELMREEIFGPLLPVKPYDSIEDAIAFVNERERPLGLYVFSRDEQVSDHVLTHTTSGGACVNACAVQGALPSLGFGGVGQSGTGRHHGIEGFREFSNPKGVFVRGSGDLIEAMFPPYGDLASAVVEGALQGPGDG